MNVPTFEPAPPEAVRYIAEHLRPQDVVELGVTNPGASLESILLESLARSRWATVVRVDGQPAIVYGVAPTADKFIGSPWMLATPAMRKIRGFFVKHCRDEVRLMQQTFPVLFNQVHRGNTCSLKWLEYVGFTIDREHPRGDLFDFWKGALRRA